MPGPAVHTIISEHLPDAFDNDHARLARVLRGNRAALTYGAMGPDPFFFNLNDLTPKEMTIAKELVEVWNRLGQIQYQMHQFFEPMQETMLEVKRQADQGITFLAQNDPAVRQLRDLANQLQETGRLYSTVMRGYVKKRLLDKMDPFGFYVSPYQTCEPDHEAWWWFDTLHTRQTGQFTTQLLDIARGQAPGKDDKTEIRDRLLAYSVGYLSHLAADVVGHAYVNTMVGGPYRLNQAQRHTAQEKLMDVYAYNHYYNETGFLQARNQVDGRYYQNEELHNSGLHKNQQFTSGKYEPKQYEIDHDRIFERPKRMAPVASGLELPKEISRNFSAAANDVYDDDEFGPLSPSEVDESYRLWYLVLRNSTSTMNVVRPENLPPTPAVSEETRQAWEDFENWYENNVGAKPGTSGSAPQCGQQGNAFQRVWDCMQTAAESLWNFANNAADATSEFFNVAMGIAEYIGQNATSIGVDELLYFLRQLYENLYASYRTLMLLLTSLGFGYCFNDQLEHQAIKHLTHPMADDHFGNTVKDTIIKPDDEDSSGYPRRGVQMGPDWEDSISGVMQGLSQEGHLVVPTTPVEEPQTIPGPDVYGDKGPEVFITDPDEDLGLDPNFIAYHQEGATDTRDPSVGPTPTREDYRPSTADEEGRFADPVLGTAVDLTVQLFTNYLRNEPGRIPDLNMSGDRGIGYPNWWNAKGCSKVRRYRWWAKHADFPPSPGKKIDWLATPIDPEYYPDPKSHY